MPAAVKNHDDLEATEVGDDVMFDLRTGTALRQP